MDAALGPGAIIFSAMLTTSHTSFDAWHAVRARMSREDPLWRMRAYQLAAFVADGSRPDAERLVRNPLTRDIASQLYRAVGSIGANVAEGYSRSSGRDRVRLFEYALGSARESRHWYRMSIRQLGEEMIARRCENLNEIIHLLLAAIPAERNRMILRGRNARP